MYREVPSAFWLKASFEEWFHRPVQFRVDNRCINCGELPCGWNCEAYMNENGYTIASGEMERI